MGDEFAQIAWGTDLGLKEDAVVAAPMYTLIDRRSVVSDSGRVRWEYLEGTWIDGACSDWVTEAESLDRFTPTAARHISRPMEPAPHLEQRTNPDSSPPEKELTHK